MSKIFICQIDDLQEGDAIKVACDHQGMAALAVFNFNGRYFAMNDKCSHGNASMSEGYLEEDGTVECPLHASKFCLKTGIPQCVPATDPIETFAVHIEDGQLYVEL